MNLKVKEFLSQDPIDKKVQTRYGINISTTNKASKLLNQGVICGRSRIEEFGSSGAPEEPDDPFGSFFFR